MFIQQQGLSPGAKGTKGKTASNKRKNQKIPRQNGKCLSGFPNSGNFPQEITTADVIKKLKNQETEKRKRITIKIK